MSAYLVIFLLFFLNLIVIPIGISPFETPKVIVAEIIIDFLLLLLIFKSKINLKHLYNPQIIFIGILFILSLDTQLLFQPQGGFFGNAFRLQGQLLLWHLFLFSIISKNIQLNNIPKFFYYLSIICLLMSTLILGVNENKRAFGTLGEPNALAAISLFIFPFVWFYSKSIFRLASIITTLSIILLSGSRAGLLGFLIQIFFILLSWKILHKKLGLAVIFCMILTTLSITLPFIENVGWFENRAEIWKTSFMSGLNSPFIGQGFGNIQNLIHQTAVNLNNNVQYQIVDSSHNFLLDFWIQGGIVAVTAIIILIGLSIHGLLKTRRILELTAFLGIITTMLFNPVSVVILLAFWWLIGQGFSTKHD